MGSAYLAMKSSTRRDKNDKREMLRPTPPKAFQCTKYHDMPTVHQRIRAPVGKEDVPAGYMYREIKYISGNRYCGLSDVALTIEGDGDMWFANGDHYEGSWFQGRRHGP